MSLPSMQSPELATQLLVISVLYLCVDFGKVTFDCVRFLLPVKQLTGDQNVVVASPVFEHS